MPGNTRKGPFHGHNLYVGLSCATLLARYGPRGFINMTDDANKRPSAPAWIGPCQRFIQRRVGGTLEREYRWTQYRSVTPRNLQRRIGAS